MSTLLDVILVSNARRYVDVLNEKFDISDHHNIIGAATRRHAPSQKPKRISTIEATNIFVQMTIWTISPLLHFTWQTYLTTLTILHGFIVR